MQKPSGSSVQWLPLKQRRSKKHAKCSLRSLAAAKLRLPCSSEAQPPLAVTKRKNTLQQPSCNEHSEKQRQCNSPCTTALMQQQTMAKHGNVQQQRARKHISKMRISG
ncbi:hypothetical protein ACFX13_047662 [Malus domestica]